MNKKYSIVNYLGILIALISPLIYVLLSTRNIAFDTWLDYYAYSMDTVIPLVYPIIIMLFYAVNVRELFTERFIISTRTRQSFTRTLHQLMGIVSIRSFLVMFSGSLITFLFCYFIAPYFNLIPLEPQSSGLDTSFKIVEHMSSMHTFSQLVRYSPLLYGIIYSLWVGLNSIIWGNLSILLFFVIENTFIALGIPYLIYQLINLTLAVFGFPQFAPLYLIFPFTIHQNPISSVILPFTFWILVVGGIYGYIRFNMSKLESIL